MYDLDAHIVADWLMNEDGNGATDEQFLETIKLMEEKIEDRLADDYTFLDWLKDVIEEIEQNQAERLDNVVLDMEKFNMYLGDNNEMCQPMIGCFGTVEEAIRRYKNDDGLNFKSVQEMKDYCDKYYFIYKGKWYHIWFDAALDVVISRSK